MKKTIFDGVATALITPFSENEKEIDLIGFKKLIYHQLNNGIDALVVAGTTGEAPVLKHSEKTKLIETAVSLSGGAVPIIAGTGSNDTQEAVRKSNDAEKLGVNGLLIVTPYYNKCTAEGLIKHFNYIADRVSVPIIIYNVPSRTGVTISPETYQELAKHKRIVAVKEASNNISDYLRAVSVSDLDFYSGNDDLTIPMMSCGAKGVVSVVSNIIPDIMRKITKYCLNNDFQSAYKLQNEYLSLINLMFCEINPIPVKSASGLIYGFSDLSRLPLTKIKSENYDKIIKEMKKFNLI